MELWLDQSVAPTLTTKAPQDDAGMLQEMIDAINDATYSMEKTLADTTAALRSTLKGFDNTVNGFNGSVRDFSEFNYNLRGTVERLDLAARDFGTAVRSATGAFGRGDN